MKKFSFVFAVAFIVIGLASSGFSSDDAYWCYNHPECGPAVWGTLDSSYETCATGMQQSPIDVKNTVIDNSLKPLSFSYHDTPLTIVNNGHTIQVNYQSGSKVIIDGVDYQLLQFHFHTPSENIINGSPFAMEAHLVHKNGDGQVAVVGVLMEKHYADDDDDDDDDADDDDDDYAGSFLQEIWSMMPVHEGEVKVIETSFNAKNLLPEDKNYYSWPGSLTTPPCTEGVSWFLMTHPVKVTPAQVDKFSRLFHGGNARPDQPLNGRTIYKSNFDD
ncbi:MAG: carbonic anhydrase family protein [Desulfobacteraceae bacterium]|nr:carbonic anhydrase family protein [Desulfobacteraceae bacterium]